MEFSFLFCIFPFISNIKLLYWCRLKLQSILVTRYLKILPQVSFSLRYPKLWVLHPSLLWLFFFLRYGKQHNWLVVSLWGYRLVCRCVHPTASPYSPRMLMLPCCPPYQNNTSLHDACAQTSLIFCSKQGKQFVSVKAVWTLEITIRNTKYYEL